jgi:hypothetical protein
VGYPRACMKQSVHLALVDVNAVCSQYLGIEQSLFFDVRDDRHSIFPAHIFHFQGGFCDVRMQRHVELGSQLRRGAQDFRCAGVRRVRCYRRCDQWVAFPPGNEFPSRSQ